MATTFTVGNDGGSYDYSAINNATAGYDAAGSIADDYIILIGKNTDGALLWSSAASLNNPVNNPNNFTLTYKGSEGSVVDEDTQIELLRTGGSDVWALTTWNYYGLQFENLYLHANSGRAIVITVPDFVIFTECNIKSSNSYSIYSTVGFNVKRCVCTGRRGISGNGAGDVLVEDSIITSSWIYGSLCSTTHLYSVYRSTIAATGGYAIANASICTLRDVLVLAKTYITNADSLPQSLHRIREVSVWYNVVLYATDNPTMMTASYTFAQWMVNVDYVKALITMENPVIIGSGDPLAKYALNESTSPAFAGNMTAADNDLYPGKKWEPVSKGMYSNFVAATVADYPAITDVRKDVDFDSGNKTGSAYIPSAANTRFGVNVDATTGLAYIPTAANTRLGVDVDQTVGVAAIPTAANTRFGVAVEETTGLAYIPTAANTRLGVAVDQTTGNVTLPTVATVKLNTTYDTLLSRTGTFAGGGSPPSTPTITIVDNADETGAVVTVAGSDGGTTNTIYYEKFGTTGWTSGGSRSGDGAVAVSITVMGLYWFYCASTDSGGTAASIPVSALLTDGSDSVMEQILTAVAATIDGASLVNSASSVVSAEIEIPPDFDKVNTSIIKVFPDTDELDPDHSTVNMARYRVNIVLCERSKTAAKQYGDMLIKQQIQDLFVGQRLSGLSLLYCTESVSSVAYDFDQLKEKFNYISPVTIEFQANRTKL